MSLLYVVMRSNWDGQHCLGVFDSEELATKYRWECEKHKHDCGPDQYDYYIEPRELNKKIDDHDKFLGLDFGDVD